MLLARGDLKCRVWDGGVNACIWHRSSGSRERCRISGFIVSVEIDAMVCVVVLDIDSCRKLETASLELCRVLVEVGGCQKRSITLLNLIICRLKTYVHLS